jgi:two-component system, NtrC family, sensor histidine kinase HydH
MTLEPRDPSAAPTVESARRQVAALSRLAGGLAHEIKNPLSTMAINLTLLEEEWKRAALARSPDNPELSPREQRCMKRVQTLKREVQRLEVILEEFLRYARGGEVNRAPADLVGIVREVLDFVEPEDAQAGIRHHVDLPSTLPMVMLDEGAFRQALLNLLVNARQAMSAGGELLVRVQRSGNFVELHITDTGVGMDEEALGRCFEVYWSTKKNGTGLGLATVRRIVEEHGGTIDVVSDVGRGTNFCVVLPLLVEIPSPARRRDLVRGVPAGAELVDAPLDAEGARGGSAGPGLDLGSADEEADGGAGAGGRP